MSKFVGRQAIVGIGKESVRGTAVAPTYYVPTMEITNSDSRIRSVKNETAIARIEASDGFSVIGKFGELGWKTKMKDRHFGLVCLSCLGTVGSVAKSAPNAVVYDHTFTVLQNAQHPSLTVAYEDPNVDVSFANAVVSSIKINAEVNNYIMYEVTTMSKAAATSTNTPAITAENDFLPQNIVFKKATTAAGLDAASAVSIRNFSLEIKNNCMYDDVLGTTDPADVLNQSFEVNGSISLTHNDTTYSVLQNAGTLQAFRFDMINSAVTIGTSANPELKIDLNSCSITNYNKKISLNDIVEESFDFTAHYSITDSKMITIVLTNLVASY